jgi:hypothetical protein
MKIGDERDPARIRLRNWQRFAKDAGLNPTVATRRLRDIMDRVAAALGTVTVPAGAESVAALVRENCERLQLEMNRE